MKKRRLFRKIGLNFRTLLDMIGIVLIWRGAWNIADTYLFPGNIIISSLVSTVVGVLILLFDDLELDELR